MIKIKIGHLHSCFQDNRVLDYFDAILIRADFETWDYCKKYNMEFLNCQYGQYSQRAKLRELIYPNIKYKHWLTITSQYSFVFLSANADTYPNRQDFTDFVKEMVNLFKPDVVGAMNEGWEKLRSIEKMENIVTWTTQGIKASTKPDLKICFYNQKIKTSNERNAIAQLVDNEIIKKYCKFFGFQSLGTSPTRLKEYIPFIKGKNFEPINVEWGTITSDFKTIKELFNDGVDKVFILTPYISQELASYDENFKKYALNINGDEKDKYKLISYIQQFKSEEEGMKIADRYQKGDKDDRCIDLIQDMLKQLKYLQYPISFGDFDEKTKQAVLKWQKDNEVEQTGIITKFHIWTMIEQQENPQAKMRQLIIYCS